MDIMNVKTDVLVIGGGLAGCRAAIRAKELGSDVLLVDKANPGRTGASLYVHSQLAPWDLSDNEFIEWMQEMVENTNYLADQDWLEVTLRDGARRINELIEWGVPYARKPDGKLKYAIARGNRVCMSLNGDGKAMMRILRQRLDDLGINVVSRIMVTHLLTSDGQLPTNGNIVGAIGFNYRTGKLWVCRAHSVVIATGPVSFKCHNGYVDNLTGDGHYLAFRAGAELAGLEFCQRAYFNYYENKFQAPGQAKLQGMGVKLVNASGESIIERYDNKWQELTSLSTFVRAIVTENLEGRGPCYIDLRHIRGEELATLREVVPVLAGAVDEFGIDTTKDLIETNAQVGLGSTHGLGIHLNLECKTNIEGLFAAGYCACLAGNMSGSVASYPSTFANVSGYRAGESAASWASKGSLQEINTNQVQELAAEIMMPMLKGGKLRPRDIYQSIYRVTSPAGYSFFKSEERLQQTLNEVYRITNEELPVVGAPDYHELVKVHEAKNYLQIAELACVAALTRKESRGAHFRVDYPFRDDSNWLKWILIKSIGNELGIDFWQLPMERYAFRPLETTKIAADIYIPSDFFYDQAQKDA